MKTKPYAVYDVEYTASYFEAGFYNGDKFIIMELPTARDTITPKQKKQLLNIFSRYTMVGFNNQSFDNPLIQAFYQGKTAHELYLMGSKCIKTNEKRWWVTNLDYDNQLFEYVDLMRSCPGRMSLKTAGARMCSNKIMDIPIDYDSDKVLTQEERDLYISYNKNDLLLTWQLLETLEPEIDLKTSIDPRWHSKGAPSVAELYLGKKFKENRPPKEISYQAPYEPKYPIAKLVKDIFEDTYSVNKAGYPEKKDWKEIVIGDREYAIGLGGLHSVNPHPEVWEDLTDIDVQSYYPSLLINFGWNRKYESTYHERITAKKTGNKQKSDSLKLILNSTFGKLADKYSGLYDPQMMLKVTLTGQLLLIDLIERLHLSGANVVYANTDGVCVQGKYEPKVIRDWEQDYNLIMEEEYFDKLFVRDVNNLFATHNDEVIKKKGIFAGMSLRKGYEHPLVYENVMRILMNKEPLPLEDNKKGLLLTRGSKTWATWDNGPVGKVLRWVWVKDGLPLINETGRVANSEGCYPIMDLEELDRCHDIDYGRYKKAINDIVLMFV